MEIYSEYEHLLLPIGLLALEPFDPCPCRSCKFHHAKKKEFLAHCSDGEHWTCIEFIAWRDRSNAYNESIKEYKESHCVY